MRLIVWKDSDTRHKYAYKLLRKFTQDMDLKTIKEVDCSIGKSIELLRGYTFDEVLWVGYEDYSERDFTAPMELLFQTVSVKKHHYCNPTEPNFDKVMMTNSLRFGKSTLKNDTLDALRYATEDYLVFGEGCVWVDSSGDFKHISPKRSDK